MSGNLLFGRAASLVLADSSGNGIELNELAFEFEVSHPSKQTPQLLRVKIYNLADATIQQISAEFSQVQLKAGYASSFGTIFNGTIAQKKVGRESSTDSFVEIYGTNNDLGYNFSSVNTTLQAGYTHANVYDVLGSSFGQFGINKQKAPAFPPQIFPRGKVMYGDAKHHARQLAATTGMNWNITTDGQFRMLPSHGSTPDQAIVITPASGLLGTPEQTINGITVRCLLNPALHIDGMIDLKTAQITPATLNFDYSVVNFFPGISKTGLYRILWVEHVGQSRGEQWESNIVCYDPTQPVAITPAVLGVGFYGPA
ncbi:MAG: hypothetical protein PHS51_03465 [Gallionella sp.]|nr:hypothetical protein [Gallionella sp.]